MARTVDVQVVGGGPAGLAFAVRAARAGLAVRLAERGRAPRDKACGEGILPEGVARLEALGVDLATLPSHPLTGIRYLDGERVAEGRFADRWGLGVRRTALHRALAELARTAGVELLWEVKAEGLVGETTVESTAGRLGGRWLVAADGLRSPLRAAAGLAGSEPPRRRFGVRRHFRCAPWSDLVEVHWADGCEAYVTPVGPAEVGVALLWSGQTAGFDELMAAFPRLASRLHAAPVVSRDRGAGPLEQRVRGVTRGRLALLGDAAGYVDAITGEGLSLAFGQGEALLTAILADDPSAYGRACRRLRRLPDGMTRLLLAVERYPALRRRVLATLSAEPELFTRLVRIHARQLPLRRLGVGGALRLIGGVVTGRAKAEQLG